jgi:hypothetical protein
MRTRMSGGVGGVTGAIPSPRPDFLLAGSEVGFAGFPCLGDFDEDAGDEPQE